MARYTNYDDLLKKWHDLGLDEISKIHKVNAFNHFIRTLPIANNVVEVKHGHWIEDGEYQVCSECGEEHHWDEYRATYCEDCGAIMKGIEK